MAKYEHNQVCTSGKEIVVGGVYDYTEDGIPARVRVMEDSSEGTEGPVGFLLEVLKDPTGLYGGPGKTFPVWAAEGRFAYSGMWRLWPEGEYL